MASPTVHFHYTYVQDAPYTQSFDADGRSDGQPVYVGWTGPGNGKGDTKWKIQKITYSGSAVTDIQWANGSAEFAFEWDERTTYAYS
jgi:hypothetical protein